MSIDVSAIKQGQKMMWTAGDYPEVSRRIASVAQLLAERVGAGPGVDMLDVATGSGNVAIAAARQGATVTGLDLTPKLLDVARGRASSAGLEIEFVEGDAEELPFEPDSFDRVTSCFVGATFRASASYMPPMPAELEPPVMWGNEEHVRSLFIDSGANVTCER